MRWVRRLYDWVLHWAETPYGAAALFVLAFAESSFFPVPPDALLIALVLGAPSKAFRLALNCTVASVLGACLGYAIGYFVWWSGPGTFSPVAWFFFNHIPGFSVDLFHEIRQLFEKWNFWIIFTAGFTPIPYKVFTIAAGVFEVPLGTLVLASALSRTGRFVLVAGLIYFLGERVRHFIEKYFDLLTVVFTILLLGGFFLIRFVK